MYPTWLHVLTHWGRVTHICVSNSTIIGSDNGLSPGRRQAIIWNNAGILLIEPLGTNFSEISIWIQRFSFKKMPLNMSSAKWRPFCLGLNVLISLYLLHNYWNWLWLWITNSLQEFTLLFWFDHITLSCGFFFTQLTHSCLNVQLVLFLFQWDQC